MKPQLSWQTCVDNKGAGRLFCGDNMAIMQALPDESVNLIYADPPFCSGKRYRQAGGGFGDVWQGGLETYLPWLMDRLTEMKRLLVPGGALYVHLDWHAVHYVKVALDDLFGRENFLNEIIWTYSAGGRSKRFWSRKHDTILYYVNGPGWIFNADAVRVPYTSDMTKWSYGRGHMQGKSMPAGKVPEDVFSDVSLNTMAKERLGYPTQKPISLLERLILASCQSGDMVADFFCGSGTTLVAAERCGRRYLGADCEPGAIALTLQRLEHPPLVQRGGTYQWWPGEAWSDPLGAIITLPSHWRLQTAGVTTETTLADTFYCAPSYSPDDFMAVGRRGLKQVESQLAICRPYGVDQLTTATGGGGNAQLLFGPDPCIIQPEAGQLAVRCQPGDCVHWWIEDGTGSCYEMAGSSVQVNAFVGGNCTVSCLVVDSEGAGAVRWRRFREEGAE